MKNVLSSNYLWPITLALFLLNLGLVGWMWFFPQRQPNGPRGETPGQFLEKELAFTPQQKEEFRILREDHHRKTKVLRDSIRQMKEAFFRHIGKTGVTDSALVQKSNAIAEKIAQIDKITFQHFSDVRKICSPQQQAKFDDVIDEMLRRLAANPERPAERPHGPMPPLPPPR